MKHVLACLAVMAALGCSAASPSTTILQPLSSVVAATPSAPPGTTASAPSPDASMASANPFAGEVTLSPLPEGTSMRLTQDEAVAIAVHSLPAADGTNSVIYVGYGMGRAVYTDKVDQPIWVVVVTANPSPHYGGPACPTASCQPNLLV